MSSNQNKSRRALAEMTNDTSSSNSNSQPIATITAGNPKVIQAKKVQLLDEFVKERQQQLEQELEIIKQEQRQLIGNCLFKMNKAVRGMTLGEYANMYGVNLLEEVPPPRVPTLAPAATMAHSGPKTPAMALRNHATPMTLRNRPMATPATVRTLRRGEAVLYVLLTQQQSSACKIVV